MDAKVFPPRMDDLLASFLARQSAAISSGAESSTGSDVEAYAAVATEAVDPRLAWDGATESLRYFAPGLKLPTKLPSSWSAIASSLPACNFLPMAAGQFPQLVRDLNSVLEMSPLKIADGLDSPEVKRFVQFSAASQEPALWFVAVGVARLTRDFDLAQRVLSAKGSLIPAELEHAWSNELAVLNWEQEQPEKAVSIWNSLPESAPVLFNLGIAEMHNQKTHLAVSHFKRAAAMIRESSGWHHLAQLYLAVAESR